MDEAVEFVSAGASLSGTLSRPEDLSRLPGVVLVGGSGPSDRHNDDLFDALRGRLVAAGIAVLTYDKRGAGRSTGSWPSATVDDLADDAGAAVATLREHPSVEPNAIGLFGHSEGGWVALRLGTRSPGPRHLILNSCPAVCFLDAEIHALGVAGVPPEAAADVMHRMAGAAARGDDYRVGQRILAGYEHEAWYAGALSGFKLSADTWAQLAAWADYDPSEDLLRLSTPMLATLGGADPLVPVDLSRRRYDETAARSSRPQRTVVFPGADHRLRVDGARFADGYLTLLTDWCLGPACRS